MVLSHGWGTEVAQHPRQQRSAGGSGEGKAIWDGFCHPDQSVPPDFQTP